MEDTHPFTRVTLSEANVYRTLEASHRKRDLSSLINDYLIMKMYLEGNSFRIAPDCFDGMRHLLDETLVLIAMRPARDEEELWLKASALQHKSPMVPANGNLEVMLVAGFKSDLLRLAPTKIPSWFGDSNKPHN